MSTKLYKVAIWERFGHHGQWDTERSGTELKEVLFDITYELADWLRHSNCTFSDIDTAMGLGIEEQSIKEIDGIEYIEKKPRDITSSYPNILHDVYKEASKIHEEREAQRKSDEAILERGKKRALLERLKKELENDN